MKNIYKHIILLLFTALVSVGCEDDLDRFPLDQLTVPTTFTTYQNVQTYAWSFYSVFGTYHRGRYDKGEHAADLMMDGRHRTGNPWLWERITVPTNSANWTNAYANIRKVNIMLDNIDNSEMSEKEINHWRSVGYFFRSYAYFGLLEKFGGVPWVENAIGDSDTDVIYAPRASRDVIAQNILDNLRYAEDNINEDGEGEGINSIGVNAVRALISRFGLFEGTWRKYHALGGESQYLTACVDASEKLMGDIQSLHYNYDELYNSTNLKGVTGIILYKEYLLGQITHPLNQWTRSSESSFWDYTKKAADMFLLSDGTPVSADTDFVNREKDPYSEFRNRDRRMYYCITPPHQVVGRVGGDAKAWEHTGDPKHREYMDLMETITDETHKMLPDINWGGLVQPITPNFKAAGSQPFLPWDPGYNTTSTGYKNFKYFSRLHIAQAWVDEHDEPVFRIGEVLLNYAEAKFELDDFDQTIADATIGELRTRVGMPNINLSAVTGAFDPERDPSVDPVLWEIRRERAVELMADGFRFNDLRRWKKMDYAAKEKVGRYIVASDFNNKLHVQGGAAEGYISVKEEGALPPAFPAHYYLYPIPSNQIVLNPQLEQNPNW
ncbi:MAG: RagB/SusD family nutrient uptake outer membrane protein [Flavobacteriaceae bacterium]|nr:MAG: RagB/SusD family nutrient uptake outer membrane protein [Flavobacteriaceae bacterium]